MTKLVPLNQIFDIKYGVNQEFNKMDTSIKEIPFIGRTSLNNGVVGYVRRLGNIKLNPANTISVSCGGSVIESFLQTKEYYSARDLYCLKPKYQLTKPQMLYYCMCLRANKYKYSFGRQANKTLDYIKVAHPDCLPAYIEYAMKKVKPPSKESILDEKIKLDVSVWKSFYIGNLFKIERGKEIVSEVEKGDISLISSSDTFNGLNKEIKEGRKVFAGNQITIANNGSVGACFYHNKKLYATNDVSVLSNNELNIYNSLFIVTIRRNEKYRFSYGRKWGIAKMKFHKIKLPATL